MQLQHQKKEQKDKSLLNNVNTIMIVHLINFVGVFNANKRNAKMIMLAYIEDSFVRIINASKWNALLIKIATKINLRKFV